MNKNLITLAILAAASAPALAVDFGVAAANTSKVNFDKWSCAKCVEAKSLTGELELAAGNAWVSDAHASNALGAEEDGAVAALSGDLLLNHRGWRVSAQAHDLGLEQGAFAVRASDLQDTAVSAEYRQFSNVDSHDGSSNLYQQGDKLIIAEPAHAVELELKRSRYQFALEQQLQLLGMPVDTRLSYRNDSRSGYQTKGLAFGGATADGVSVAQMATRVDDNTQTIDAVATLLGSNWLASVDYMASLYENQQGGLYHDTFGSLYASAPDNQAHQIGLSGNYLASVGQFDGRLAVGRMIQDDQLVNLMASPVSNWDGEIDTIDAMARYTGMVTPKLRLQGSLSHNQRDHNSSVLQFPQSYGFDAVSGVVEENVLVDSDRQQAKLNAQYRVAKGLRLDAGYHFDRNDRQQSDGLGQQEATNEHQLSAGIKYSALANWTFRAEAGIGERDGSDYAANDITSGEDNTLLRKYYLADRRRTHAQFSVKHQPSTKVAVELTADIANDDYHNSELGLTNAKDYGYQLQLSLLPRANVSMYAFAAQQWIDSEQRGDYNGVWDATINDQFITFGLGGEIAKLWRQQLSVGFDYLYADSSSDASNSAVIETGFDDYYSYSHSAELYAKYQLSNRSAIKLKYQYERLFDTDYQSVATDAVSGFQSLGNLDHNYNAHLLMLSYSISL